MLLPPSPLIGDIFQGLKISHLICIQFFGSAEFLFCFLTKDMTKHLDYVNIEIS